MFLRARIFDLLRLEWCGIDSDEEKAIPIILENSKNTSAWGMGSMLFDWAEKAIKKFIVGFKSDTVGTEQKEPVEDEK